MAAAEWTSYFGPLPALIRPCFRAVAGRFWLSNSSIGSPTDRLTPMNTATTHGGTAK